MSAHIAIKKLLEFLGDLYQNDTNAGGVETAQALYDVAKNLPTDLPPPNLPKPGLTEQALAHNPHEGAQIIIDAVPHLSWFDPAAAINDLASHKAVAMMACELIGPDGMFACDEFRAGLYIQDPDFTYASRSHAAAETYIMLGGAGYWAIDDETPSLRKTGEIIHHPSWIKHSNQTKEHPMISTWRWSGDISYDSYVTT